MHYDVIVIGAGHAGAEAATAAARMGASTLLVTSNLDTIGQMSCNPAVGGIAKGTVVREVDAMGGIMGRAADRATIQFRMLNRSKGPAVWAPRAQCDRGLYRRAARHLLEQHRTLETIQGTVIALELAQDAVEGVRLADGRSFRSRSVVVTAGTFLRGKIHIGLDTKVAAGRAGEHAVVDIAEQLQAMGLVVDRFKTGTPPRIDGRSIDYSALERQDGDEGGFGFSVFDSGIRPRQVPCWITWAGAEVQEIIRGSLQTSALYGGEIAGRGPRYCPSIEDKVVKFPDAERHQIFLEPEGLDTSEIYVNGLSTSLPIDTQVSILQSVPGLSTVRMTRPGYAIEYDYFPPHQLTPWLEVKPVERLFFAGQINGTTGYEEAAGQGLMAGMNAVRRARNQEPVCLARDDGFVGVLVDDLVTRGVDEPYRLFTSRSEFRLLTRQDNAVARLGPLALQLGMLTDREARILETRLNKEEALVGWARSTSLSPEEANPLLQSCGEAEIRQAKRIDELSRRPKLGLKDLAKALDLEMSTEGEEWTSVEIELKYVGYLQRERAAADKLAEMASFHLPKDLPYAELLSLSTEARQKLESIRPGSLAQAGRIPGVSPSDLQNLVVEVVRRRKSAA